MIYEQRTLGNERVDTIRITLDTPPELMAQYSQDGYTEVMEHYLVLYKPPVDVEEAVQEAVAEKDALIASVAAALPDDLAVQHKQLYPNYRVGMTLQPQQRFRHDGALYRYIQPAKDHVTQADWPPATTPALYSRVQEPGAGPEPWVNGTGYEFGIRVTHVGKTWENTLKGMPNTWEPGAPGIDERYWKEIHA